MNTLAISSHRCASKDTAACGVPLRAPLRAWFVCMTVLVAGHATGSDLSASEVATQFISTYAKLENSSDPALADLISDEAMIYFDDAQSTIDGKAYKRLLMQAMLLKRQQPYTSESKWKARGKKGHESESTFCGTPSPETSTAGCPS